MNTHTNEEQYIYYSPSISGGYGEVLTEHIGLDEPWNAPHLCAFASGQGSIDKDKCIFETDMNWLHSSNVVVAECTVPSLGVGFELGVAWKLDLPTLVLYRPADAHVSGLSALIRGAPSKKWHIVDYKGINDLDEYFTSFFTQYAPKK
uniref:2'-deoxynucleoside 5'-phosphate N-hydrolase 1 n=1 Tax=Parascaris equorum TaxID=6256 RepID=A0A914RNE3_PAREQ